MKTTALLLTITIVAASVAVFALPAQSGSLCVDYDASVLPTQSSQGFTTRVLSGASWYSSNNELHMITSQGSPTATGVWFGNHSCCGRPDWTIPNDDEGVYLYIRARVLPGSTWWYWYITNEAYFAGMSLPTDNSLTCTIGDGTSTEPYIFDATVYHDYALLLKEGTVTYWVDGLELYSGPALPTTSSSNLLIGDGYGSTLRGTGEIIVDHVTITHGPGNVGLLPIVSAFDSDLDGWVLSGAPNTALRWESTGGNPGGFAHYTDQASDTGTLFAPAKFLGDWSQYDGQGLIRYEHILIDLGYLGTGWEVIPHQIQIDGPGGTAVYAPSDPPDIGGWMGVSAPLIASDWQILRGTWEDILQYVALLSLRVEVVDNGAGPPGSVLDQEGMDNIVLESAPLVGSITGTIAATCSGETTSLMGVQVDAYMLDLGGPVANAVTDDLGHFELHDLPIGAYFLSPVTPIGYSANIAEIETNVIGGQTSSVSFDLDCISPTGEPRDIGFWKHQIGVATGGNGHPHIDGATLCDYLDVIEQHFNSNAINQVVVYEPPVSGLCEDKLAGARNLLNLKGKQETIARARQHLMALLFNAAAQYISLSSIVSFDGATLSQAITYCDNLVDNPEGDHDLARLIAESINQGRMIAAGIIPLDTDDIAYRLPDPRARSAVTLFNNSPNPFNPMTKIAFELRNASYVRLTIFSVDGRRLAKLLDENRQPGRHETIWDGLDDSGRPVASGTYFYRLEVGNFSETKRMTLVK